MKNTKEYNEKMPLEERQKVLMEAKGGIWYDGWKPYHIELPYNPKCSSPRMAEMPWGFKCPSCGGEIGWNLEKIEEEPRKIMNHPQYPGSNNNVA